MKKQRVIVWFRQDLRLHDNEALTDAIKSGEEVIPVYVFDDRVFKSTTRFGFPKTGKYRARFIIESIKDLRASLKQLGCNLIVRSGITEDIIFDLAQEVKSSWIFCNRERTTEEVAVQDALEQKLWSVGQEVRYSRGKMLYYTADLPFPVTHTPDTFSHFRKEVERFVHVREPLATPDKVTQPWTVRIEEGEIPSLVDLGHEDFEPDERSVLSFKGGEREGLNRLRYYLWESDLVSNYKESRNGMLGEDYSTKFSVWLSQGCLSPKTVYYELKKYEAERGANKSTYWVFFELMWRDFFRLMGKKHGKHIFLKGGTKQIVNPELKSDLQLFHIWAEGRTGVPFIDANMAELNSTGFMSNRGRQNVASFLVHDLSVNWQMGAEYFESLLIDYDPTSNWGNWNYVAGVGSDPRENRRFNILSQAKKYDAHGDYVRHWIPALYDIPSARVHQPDRLSSAEQIDFHIKLGMDYPKPMINTEKWT